MGCVATHQSLVVEDLGAADLGHDQSTAQISPSLVDPDFHGIFLLGKKLGRGSFAQVRAAVKRKPGPYDCSEDEEVAVKIINLREKTKPQEPNKGLHASAVRETKIWSSLGLHPNCMRLHNVFFGDQFCYMVMEKCHVSLYQTLEEIPDLTERALGLIFAQMLLGISHCHSRSVVHRDIKPDNFLVCHEQGKQIVKLGDFGFSCHIPSQGMVQGVFGTPPFMCPEMLLGDWYDQKADVWSFAVIVYILLFGAFPYMPRESTSKAMKDAIRAGATPSFEPVQPRAATVSSTLHCKPSRARPRSRFDWNGQARTQEAMDFVKSLLTRDPKQRPSAQEAVHMPWMTAILQGREVWDKPLPSLRPMLHHARKAGAFAAQEKAGVTDVDVLLNQLQTQWHGVAPCKQKDQPKKDSWEETSNRSTACGSSDQHAASSDRRGSHGSFGSTTV